MHLLVRFSQGSTTGTTWASRPETLRAAYHSLYTRQLNLVRIFDEEGVKVIAGSASARHRRGGASRSVLLAGEPHVDDREDRRDTLGDLARRCDDGGDERPVAQVLVQVTHDQGGHRRARRRGRAADMG